MSDEVTVEELRDAADTIWRAVDSEHRPAVSHFISTANQLSAMADDMSKPRFEVRVMEYGHVHVVYIQKSDGNYFAVYIGKESREQPNLNPDFPGGNPVIEAAEVVWAAR